MNEQAKDIVKEMIEDGSASMQMARTPKHDAHGNVYAEDIGIYIRVIKQVAPLWHHSSTDLYTKCGANGSMTSIKENVTCQDCLEMMARIEARSLQATRTLFVADEAQCISLGVVGTVIEGPCEADGLPITEIDKLILGDDHRWECTCKSLLHGHEPGCPMGEKIG